MMMLRHETLHELDKQMSLGTHPGEHWPAELRVKRTRVGLEEQGLRVQIATDQLGVSATWGHLPLQIGAAALPKRAKEARYELTTQREGPHVILLVGHIAQRKPRARLVHGEELGRECVVPQSHGVRVNRMLFVTAGAAVQVGPSRQPLIHLGQPEFGL